MNLSAPFIKRPIMTTLVMAAILFLGILAFRNLPVSNLPDVDYPSISVTVAYPGANPETMASTVATPLEKEFMTIPGIAYVTSANTLGASNIVLQFEISKSIESAAQDVQAAIARAKFNLPSDLPNEPTYNKVNPSDTPIIYIALTSETLPLSDLYTYANTYIGQRLSMLEGVAKVQTYGAPFAVRVQVNPDKMANLGITFTDISQAIVNGSPYMPSGEINSNHRSATIVAQGQLDNAEKYDSLIVAYHNHSPVRIRDIGKAIDSLQNNKFQLSYHDAKKSLPTIVLAVQRQPNANTVKVAEEIHKALPKIANQLPNTADLRIVFDRSESIKESVAEVEFTLIISLALVVMVIFFYLGNLTDTIIPSLVLPMSIMGTFIFMYLFGYSIDNLSLLALTLAVGFIIDDAIIVLENIVRRVEAGETPWYAALEGSKQIGFTIISMTLSLAAAFIPMIFMGGLIGKIFQEFAITLLVITLISGIISLTLTPMLCSRFIKSMKDKKPKYIERFAIAVNNTLLAIYKPCLKWILVHRWVALVLGIATVLASSYYFYSLPKDFIPDDDIGFVIGFTQADEGTAPSKMVEYQNKVVDVIKSEHSIDSFVSLAAIPQYRNGIIFIRMKPKADRSPITEVMQRLYGQLMMIPGVNTFLRNVPLIDLSIGPHTNGAYQYTLQSIETKALFEATEKMMAKMETLAGFQSISSNLEVKSPQLNLEILRDQAASLGISASDIEMALQLAYAGGRVSRIQTSVDQYDVILEVEPRYQMQSKTLAKIYVRSSITGKLIPLSSVAKWRDTVGAASINHVSQFPATTISFNLVPGLPLGTALDQLREAAKTILPANVFGEIKGAAQTFEESIQSMGFLLILAVLAIYIVLGILYESFVHPLTILSTLPPATFGALITLQYFGLPLSLYSFLGIILLVGIVKKNGIIMVDYALENERHHRMSPYDAIFNACIVRFRPIMMTTVTAIMGALPIALAAGSGAEARRPLGLVIIGGLIFSQLITLFITPVIYLFLNRFNAKLTLKSAEASDILIYRA